MVKRTDAGVAAAWWVVRNMYLSGVAASNAAKRGKNEGRSMNNQYLEVISLVERLHRQFLEVVKLELDGLGIHDINNVQGMMLFNIGDT